MWHLCMFNWLCENFVVWHSTVLVVCDICVCYIVNTWITYLLYIWYSTVLHTKTKQKRREKNTQYFCSIYLNFVLYTAVLYHILRVSIFVCTSTHLNWNHQFPYWNMYFQVTFKLCYVNLWFVASCQTHCHPLITWNVRKI